MIIMIYREIEDVLEILDLLIVGHYEVLMEREGIYWTMWKRNSNNFDVKIIRWFARRRVDWVVNQGEMGNFYE
jgi:hypothetical protein